ncbi:MAG: hypothetical protein HEQ32_02970 [Vampirovibrio sp.]|jgi:hypothetical protein
MISSVISKGSFANNAHVVQTRTEGQRLTHVRQHSWIKTFMMTNPITAPMVLVSELVSGTKRRSA